jgi:hypothetical protein
MMPFAPALLGLEMRVLSRLFVPDNSHENLVLILSELDRMPKSTSLELAVL